MSDVHPRNQSDLLIKNGQDCITLLARDPHWLYVYWELSENRKNSLIEDFGLEIINKSVPVLKITNMTKNEYFFVRINEFSESWYVNVPDSNNVYSIEIGRRTSDDFFISVLNSNSITTPGDSVSHNTSTYFVNYTGLKDGTLTMENITAIESKEISCIHPNIAATSSHEFIKLPENENIYGESSAHYYINK